MLGDSGVLVSLCVKIVNHFNDFYTVIFVAINTVNFAHYLTICLDQIYYFIEET